MVQRNASADNEEPVQSDFEKPSEKEHLFQVSDVYDEENHPENFDIDDPDIIFAQCEVVGGDEEGRTLLIQCCLDDSLKRFYYTRMFLKVIGQQYKGDNFPIDSDEWQGKQFYATVVHTKGKNDKYYANVKEYNFEKMVEKNPTGAGGGKDIDNKPESAISWDE